MKYKSELKRMSTQSKAVRILVEENKEYARVLKMLAEYAEPGPLVEDYSSLRVKLDIIKALAKEALGENNELRTNSNHNS